jgi:hypothetical protein
MPIAFTRHRIFLPRPMLKIDSPKPPKIKERWAHKDSNLGPVD